VARTYLFDQFLSREIQAGADLVVNLAAGLDARPYRMEVPSGFQWFEVDLPEIIGYKEEVLQNEEPRCHLRRISLDLAESTKRGEFFSEVNALGKNAVVMSEGLLIYFSSEEVSSLAKDIAAREHLCTWIIDLTSPGQLRLMQRSTGKQLSEANAAFKFAPQEGAHFFASYGWQPADVQGLLKTAARLGRAPTELLSLLPEPKEISGNYPWTGVCLLKKR